MSGPPIAVIGCGSIGARHLRNLASLGIGPLLAFDTDRNRAAQAAQAVSATTVDSLDALPDLAGAFICTPTSRHLEAATVALERGAHLYIEKPISDSIEGVGALIEGAEKRGREIIVGFNLRFHPCLQRIRHLIADGAIGQVLGSRIEFGQYLPDWHPWEDFRRGYSANRGLGGGIVLDAVHEFDYARWLLGEVVSVAAMIDRTGTIEIETEDRAACILKHVDGAISEIHLDYLQRVYGRTCKVIGSEGTIWWDWHARAVRCFRVSTGTWEEYPEPKNYDPNQMYLDAVRNFTAVAAGSEPPNVNGRDGARVLEVALAAKRAAAERRTVDL